MTDAASGIMVAGIEGTTITPAELRFFTAEQIAGVTLFKYNMTPRFADLKDLISAFNATQTAGSPPTIMAIDQEGGRVARMKAPFPDFGPAQKIADGKSDEAALSYIHSYGFSVGSCLRGFGMNVDFAPVCDVLTNPTNLAIGDRVWGIDPEAAALRSEAFLQGMAAADVLGCIKHFPGQGDAAVDTHKGSAVVRGSLEELEKRELVPFMKLLSQSPMVMMAHVIYPDVCEQRAGASQIWMEEILRGKYGYQGVIVSDDMNMGAVAQDEKAWQEELVASVIAGVDMLLVCRYLERIKIALEGLRKEMARSKAFSQRMTVAAKRVLSMRKSIRV